MLRLIHEEALSYREIAARLRISESAVKSRVHHIRQLARLFQEEE
jgi:DNA-directed RNA polymerase specialized sigma24 family protein